jgi:hypothetical protein
VSPLVKEVDDGWFASSVSIRSGSGSETTDRVIRLLPLFRCISDAASFARLEAAQWIENSRGTSRAWASAAA